MWQRESQVWGSRRASSRYSWTALRRVKQSRNDAEARDWEDEDGEEARERRLEERWEIKACEVEGKLVDLKWQDLVGFGGEGFGKERLRLKLDTILEVIGERERERER